MEVERISTDKRETGHYYHKFKFKGVLKHAKRRAQLIPIDAIFSINNYGMYVMGENDDDLLVIADTTDTTPNNAINKSAWILRQLDKLIGLKLED
jgi:hypothetical protein